MNTKITSLLTSAVLTGLLASQAANADHHHKDGKHKGECTAEEKAKMKKDGKGECCSKGEKGGCGGMASEKTTEAPPAATPADAAPAGKGK